MRKNSSYPESQLAWFDVLPHLSELFPTALLVSPLKVNPVMACARPVT
jgi:hypothetical protein